MNIFGITAVFLALLCGPCFSAEAAGRPTEAEVLYALGKGSAQQKMDAMRNIDVLEDQGYAPRLLAALVSGDEPVAVRVAAFDALTAFPKSPAAESAALTGAADTSAPVRAAAVKLLGSINTAAARDALRSAVMDSEKEVRLAALRALGQQRDFASTDRVLVALQGADFDTRREGLLALERIGNPKTLTALTAFAQDPSPVIGAIAMRAIGRMGTPEAQSALRGVIDSRADMTVRGAALAALGWIKNDANLDLLARAARSSDERLAESALFGLEKFGARALKPLAAVLEDGVVPRLRMQAGHLLYYSAPGPAVPYFTAVARDTGAPLDLRLACVEWLGGIATADAISSLRKIARDKNDQLAEKARGLLAKNQEKL